MQTDHIYKEAYYKAFNGISNMIEELEAKASAFPEVNSLVLQLKFLQQDCEELVIDFEPQRNVILRMQTH